MAMGDSSQALDTIRTSLHLRETAQNKSLFVDMVRLMRWTADHPALRLLLTRAMNDPWSRPERLTATATSMIKHGPVTGPLIAKANQSWPKPLAAAELFGADGLAALNTDRLLLALLTNAQNTDLELERFLTLARRALLEVEGEEGLDFRCALARQCFINEYVFFQDAEETARADKMHAALAAALDSGKPIAASLVAAVASYFPLSDLPRLLEQQWPAPVGALLIQQVAEPAEEHRVAAAIPAITPIDDAVSQKVRAMYEENPYPRWVKAPPPVLQDTIAGYLRKRFPQAAFVRESENQGRFLSAGCGTSHLALEFARNIRANILAVDLSLASLGYAKRKSDELGVRNIEFAQADLQALEGHFDIIESCGVLHHMADPFGAWRHLLGLLNPGGFMLVALYSETARRGVVRMRDFIAQKGYGSSAAEIRRARQDILALPDTTRVTTAADFFGISTCRDLLFHVQEQRMTLPVIAAFLKENGLDLLGFELDSDSLAAYRKRFPADAAANDLDNWAAFEADNPDTFNGMYNFWVQKTA
jgi:SAM-dependent methyltransferase